MTDKALEQAADRYTTSTRPRSSRTQGIRESFIAGAEWQKEQIKKAGTSAFSLEEGKREGKAEAAEQVTRLAERITQLQITCGDLTDKLDRAKAEARAEILGWLRSRDAAEFSDPYTPPMNENWADWLETKFKEGDK